MGSTTAGRGRLLLLGAPTAISSPSCSESARRPLEIFERPIGYHTHAGQVVFEPFCGSGSQLIAAARTGRRCYAMELAPEFVDVARIRWTNFAQKAGIDPGPGALTDEGSRG